MTDEHISEIRSILNAAYPGWGGLTDPRFVKDEIDYKREAVERARSQLSHSALTALIEQSKFVEVVERLEELGTKATNLLYLSTPSTGDLALLYDPALDKEAFADRILDLLHGGDSSPERLGRFCAWLTEQSLPNKWTFPTYFLFLVKPEDNLFVKPRSVGRFLEIVDAEFKLGSDPDEDVYRQLLEMGAQLNERLFEGAPTDMVPAQSVIWIVGRRGFEMGAHGLDDAGQQTLEHLLDEFEESYVDSEEGNAHWAGYRTFHETARQNYEEVIEARDAGQDVTDLVLTRLLPHRDTASNRARGAWIHIAPAVQGDVKTWFQNAGWVEPEDWPQISRTILSFVESVVEDPDSLDVACKKFAASEYSTGFQTGMLTPILSALVPDQLILINNKSRAVVNHFLGLSHSQKIEDYPELNTAAHYLINRLHGRLSELVPEDISAQEGFDALTHWLVAVKNYRFGRKQAWKISVPDTGEWSSWRDGGYVGLTEPALGAADQIKKKQWEDVRAKALKDQHDTTGERLDEVWNLATDPQEGDLVLVTLGTEKALGLGMVVGPYEFHPEHPPQHRVPIDWMDTDVRGISEPGWRRRFQDIDPDKVDKIRGLRPLGETVGDSAFTTRTFELLDSLHQTPTRDFYSEHQEEFQVSVEQPLQELFARIAAVLPPAMKEVLETEKRLFSRIPKNDYGRGGAWDFYWGAFYPRAGKRISGAQLFLSVHRDCIDFGFHIGDYADEQRTRFLYNVQKRGAALKTALSKYIKDDHYLFGVQRDESGRLTRDRAKESLAGWLDDATNAQLSIRVAVPRDEVLSTSASVLETRVLETFRQLFPLVLVATSDDPLPAISEYWEADTEDLEIQPEYSLEDCAAETGFEVAELRSWVTATERKKQAIFYGPPGTGKTFMAELIARHMVGGGDGFVELVQFHPAYAYEDFMQGIRPLTRADGDLEYQMVPGRFLEFCRRAQNRSGTCVLIIDEINRANLSRVFGELMYLLEYRGNEIPLSGGGTFRIPPNVRLLGTMNTADRSIALVDHALRRRFAFIALRPEFDVLRAYHDRTGRSVEALIEKLTQMNQAIGDPDYHIGITFFMDAELEENLEAIWCMEIVPYLEEFFFGDRATVDRFRWEKIGEELLV